MENQTQQKTVPTKDTQGMQTENNVLISRREAEEYRAYKRNKLQSEIVQALRLSEGSLMGGEDVQRVCDRAKRLKQSAVKMPLSRLAACSYYLAGSSVKTDCVVGGNGETLAKVKAFEARLAAKKKAAEITVVLAPSMIDSCRFADIRRELKKVRRAAGRVPLKVRVDKAWQTGTLARLARICCDVRAKFFSVPYYDGCEKLKINFSRACSLEVSGVENTETYQKLVKSGVARIVTDRGFEIYAEWLQSGYDALKDKPKPPQEDKPQKDVEILPPPVSDIPAPPRETSENKTSNPDDDYRCRLEGTKLVFY